MSCEAESLISFRLNEHLLNLTPANRNGVPLSGWTNAAVNKIASHVFRWSNIRRLGQKFPRRSVCLIKELAAQRSIKLGSHSHTES